MTNETTAIPVSYLRNEYEHRQALFNAQPTIIQRFIEAQAQKMAAAVINKAGRVRFTLPDRVIDRIPHAGEMATMLVPENVREQGAGGWLHSLTKKELHEELRQRLFSLEQSPDQAINSSTSLLRYAVAVHMVHNMLPSGRTVTYRADGDEQTPSIPVPSTDEAGSAITAEGDAIAEVGDAEKSRGKLLVPFVPAARRFFLPQWVAFDEEGNLLVNSIAQAEANLESMEHYVEILHSASSLAPYMVADKEYQCKRYGILGQVINQGRALARYKTGQIIKTIQERVEKQTLNRGLSILLPYYDDQKLQMSQIKMEVIPAGRIEFKTVFALRAMRLEHAKVSQDTRINASTRKHILLELEMFEQAFHTIFEQAVK